jgi:hypothetical protein
MIDLNTGRIGDNRRLAKVPAGDLHIHDILNTAEEEQVRSWLALVQADDHRIP